MNRETRIPASCRRLTAAWNASALGQHGGVLFSALAQVHQQRGVAAVVQDHVRAFAFAALGAEVEDAVGVVPVVDQGLALDGEHRRAGGGDGGGGVVLRGEDVARRPRNVGAQGHQRFDEYGRLDGHVQAAGNAGTLQRLRWAIFFAQRHQAGHFSLSQTNFLAAPLGQRNIFYFIGDAGRRRSWVRIEHDAGSLAFQPQR